MGFSILFFLAKSDIKIDQKSIKKTHKKTA